MALSPRLELRQSQTLVMTPQLQQAIKLLQLNNLELTAFVEQELERNPLLERSAGDEGGGGDDLASRLAAALASKRTSEPQQSSPRGGLLSRALSNSKIPAHAAPISNTLVSLDPSQQLDDDGDDWDTPPQALLQLQP